jgi:hypothetical protein
MPSINRHMDRFVPRDDRVGVLKPPASLRGAAFSREEQSDVAGRGNPCPRSTAAWIASFLAMTGLVC